MFEDLPDDDPRITALIAAERAAGAAYLVCNDALLELWASTPAGDRVGRCPQVLAEAGLALGLHPVSVEARLGVALSLQDHPLLRALLADGRLGVAHVLVAVELVGTLGDEDLGDQVLHAVLAAGPRGEPGWDGTPSELRRALQRAAVRTDPVGAARRREEQTAARTGVRLRPLPDGLAAWVATGSAAQLLAADRLLDVASRPSDPDDPRSRGQRQVDALLGALLSRVGTGAVLELQLEVPVTVTETAPVRGCAPEPVAIRAELTPELLALLAADPAPAATQAATPAAAPPAVPSPVTTAPRAARPAPGAPGPTASAPDALAAFPATPPGAGRPPSSGGEAAGEPPRDGRARTAPSRTAPVPRARAAAPADAPQPTVAPGLEHRAVRRPSPSTVPELLEIGAVDVGLLAELVGDPAGLPLGLRGVTVRRVCTDGQGQVVAVDASAVPLARLLEPVGRPTVDQQRLLARLLRALPAPPRATANYRPTADQARVVRARDVVCSYPGCCRSARRGDLDHRRRHPDGATSTSNLHPLCRHHHRLKHAGGRAAGTGTGARPGRARGGSSAGRRPPHDPVGLVRPGTRRKASVRPPGAPDGRRTQGGDTAPARRRRPMSPDRTDATLTPVTFPVTPELPASGPSRSARDLRLLADVEVQLSVQLGRVRLPMRELLSLDAGSVVELDRSAESPVDVLVNGRLVARGEVVVVEGEFGVRITSIVEP